METAFSVWPVQANEYQKYICDEMPVYLSADFCELNRSKVDEVQYLLIKKRGSPRFLLSIGIKGKEALCPFSAPFAYLATLKKGQTVEDFDGAMESLDTYAREQGWKCVQMTLPPFFYDSNVLSAWANVFFRHGFACKTLDLNFALDLNSLDPARYSDMLSPNTRRNLKIANNSELSILSCESEVDMREAYAVIADNRAAKGYPLRMTLEQVLATLKIVPHDMFLVSHEGESIAAAMVYHVRSRIAQVIYWGDRPGYSEFKPINFLAYQLLRYYKERGFSWLDIGPSTEDSVPNYGLCSFKESIGCIRAPKLTLIKEYD